MDNNLINNIDKKKIKPWNSGPIIKEEINKLISKEDSICKTYKKTISEKK